MALEHHFKELIKEAVREVIEEEIQCGRLQQGTKTEPPVKQEPSTMIEPSMTRDPHSIIRPAVLSEMLSVSVQTLWRWEKSGQLPARIHLGGRSVGWRYGDIEEWLRR